MRQKRLKKFQSSDFAHAVSGRCGPSVPEQTPDLFFEFRPRLIVLVLNDPHSALTREPVPHVGHVLQSLSLLRRFHFSR